MLAHEPDGITIGAPGSQAFRNPRASATASSRRPSLKGACPQQKVLRRGDTLSFKSVRIFFVASIAAGKNSSARQVANSFTSVISIFAARSLVLCKIDLRKNLNGRPRTAALILPIRCRENPCHAAGQELSNVQQLHELLRRRAPCAQEFAPRVSDRSRRTDFPHPVLWSIASLWRLPALDVREFHPRGIALVPQSQKWH